MWTSVQMQCGDGKKVHGFRAIITSPNGNEKEKKTE